MQVAYGVNSDLTALIKLSWEYVITQGARDAFASLERNNEVHTLAARGRFI